MRDFLVFSNLTFGYPSAAGDIFIDFNQHFAPGWHGIVGANGAGKSTLLQLACGNLHPDIGTVKASGSVMLCQQTVDTPPENAEAFFSAHTAAAIRLRNELALNIEMLDRWETLSMGERKKLQIAAALFEPPGVLCLDEPTNHLDSVARRELLAVLRTYRGVGLLVSHDRELLDTLCTDCLFLRPAAARLRSGGVSDGIAEEGIEREANHRELEKLKTEAKKAKKELQRRREKEQKSANADSKRKLDRHDRDGKGRIDAARVSSRAGKASEMAGAQKKTLDRKETELNSLEYLKAPKLGLSIPYGAYSRRDLLLQLPTGGIDIGEKRLEWQELELGSHDRVALTGANGAGKSSFLRHIMPLLRLESEQILFMPQELTPADHQRITAELDLLGRNEYSKVMSVVASLGSLPERVKATSQPSPGEWRKLFFGLGVLHGVNLIVMDEPTNHLDLPSIECLEAALRDCATALILVSHDAAFLGNTCSINWEISAGRIAKKILDGTCRK